MELESSKNDTEKNRQSSFRKMVCVVIESGIGRKVRHPTRNIFKNVLNLVEKSMDLYNKFFELQIIE